MNLTYKFYITNILQKTSYL